MVGNISGKGSGGLSILNSLNKNQDKRTSLFKDLASGQKAFSADAAAGAIAAQIDAIDTALAQGTRNTRDFVSVAALRDSATTQVAALEERRTELAAQASNGTFSDEQRAVLNEEFQALGQEIDRITATTEFNGINLFGGTSLTAQVGADSSESSQISLAAVDISADTSQNILTQEAARTALDSSETQRTQIASIRASDGAAVARLEAAAENNESTRLALQSARSQLRDVDIAETAAELTRQNVLADGNVALSAQANQNQQTVLNLLR